MKKTNNEYCALTFDHVAVDKYMNQWHMEREKKGNIYNSYGEYIQFLEDRLESETDSFEIIIIKQEIKKLKKEQKKYYVPSILEGANFSLVRSRDDSCNSLEKANFSLVKKVKVRSRRKK